MSYSYVDSLTTDTRKRYDLKLSTVGLKECPYRQPADSWTNDPTEWSELEFGDLHIYLTSTPGVFTQSAMKAYKSLEAHKFFRSGFVQTVYHLKTLGNIVFKADVRPSQRMNDPSHQPWVAANRGGTVLTAHCTCMAGLGESCSHVAALLFKVETAVRLGVTKLACTSRPCEWKTIPYKKYSQPESDIKFYRSEVVEKVQNSGRKRRATSDLPGTDYNQQQAFIHSLLQVKSTPVGLSLFAETSCNFVCKRPYIPTISLHQPLRSIYKLEHANLSDAAIQQKACRVLTDLSISKAQVDYLEQSTIGQSSQVMWHTQRAGHISSSTGRGVLHTNREHPAASVIKNITQLNTKPIRSAAIVYGRENESNAYTMYTELMECFHVNMKCEHTGMRVSVDNPWLSASADGILHCDCHGTGVLEIKCQWSARDVTPEQLICDPSSYVYQGILNQKHKYYTQIQIEMVVYEAAFCDFVVLTKDGLIHQTVSKDTDFIQDMIPKLKEFWSCHIVPELLTRTLEKSQCKEKQLLSKKTTQKLYCYCQQPENGTPMVGCDGKDCPYEWVQLSCIYSRRKTLPKGNWYCMVCKK